MSKNTLPAKADDAVPAHGSSNANGHQHPEAEPADHHDPLIGILAAFEAIPLQHRDSLFADFRAAAEAKDLRRLLDTIADWAATAELYADPALALEVAEARGDRREAADGLRG